MGEISPYEQFRIWVATRINEYLESNPHVTVQDLADRVGVSAPTVSRWRSGQTNVTQQHQQGLFRCLQINAEDLAREGVVPPTVRTRGPVRTRGAVRTRGPAAVGERVAAGGKLSSAGAGPQAPKRVFAIAGHLLVPGRLTWLAELAEREQRAFADFVGQRTVLRQVDASRYVLAEVETVVLALSPLSVEILFSILDGVRITAQPGDLLIVHLWAALTSRDEVLRIRLPDEATSLTLGDVCERVAGAAPSSLLAVQVLEPDDGCDLFGHGPRADRELRGMQHPGLAVILAALPAQKSASRNWPLFSRLLREGLAGAADLNEDGLITAGELCEFAGSQVQPRNLEALGQLAVGQSAVVVPAPRLIAGPSETELVVAVRSDTRQAVT